MIRRSHITILSCLILTLFSLYFECALANEPKPNLLMTSTGGLKLINQSMDKEQTLFMISGQVRWDETVFTGNYKDKQNDFPSGAHIRSLEIAFNGNLSQTLAYKINGCFTGSDAFLLDAYVNYTGMGPHNTLTVGQLPSPFGLENTCSSKWLSFLERSLVSSAFVPCYGLGVAGFFLDNGQVRLLMALTRSPQTSLNNQEHKERGGFTTRLFYSPIHTEERVYHIGISSRFQDTKHHAVVFATRPEARARHTAVLLNTHKIASQNYWIGAGEIAGLWGPFSVQGEYMKARVRALLMPSSTLSFQGWYLQSSYVLTGESREYDFWHGTFGRVNPQSPCGAWEVALRYSYLNLNDKLIQGGNEHNLSLSLGWYASRQLRIFGNYIRAHIDPMNNGTKRRLNIIGIRFKLSF